MNAKSDDEAWDEVDAFFDEKEKEKKNARGDLGPSFASK